MTTTTGFLLSGDHFELPLPEGWEEHPEQRRYDDHHAICPSVPYEVVVTTSRVRLDRLIEDGSSLATFLQEYTELRRATAVRGARSPSDVTPVAQVAFRDDLDGFSFLGTLADPVRVFQFCAVFGGVLQADPARAVLLAVSFYDYRGPSGMREALQTWSGIAKGFELRGVAAAH